MTTKEKQLVERIDVKNSPFTIVRNENDYYLTMGKYRLHGKGMSSEKECLNYLEENRWNIIGIICSIMFDNLNKVNNE